MNRKENFDIIENLNDNNCSEPTAPVFEQQNQYFNQVMNMSGPLKVGIFLQNLSEMGDQIYQANKLQQ